MVYVDSVQLDLILWKKTRMLDVWSGCVSDDNKTFKYNPNKCLVQCSCYLKIFLYIMLTNMFHYSRYARFYIITFFTSSRTDTFGSNTYSEQTVIMFIPLIKR